MANAGIPVHQAWQDGLKNGTAADYATQREVCEFVFFFFFFFLGGGGGGGGGGPPPTQTKKVFVKIKL